MDAFFQQAAQGGITAEQARAGVYFSAEQGGYAPAAVDDAVVRVLDEALLGDHRRRAEAADSAYLSEMQQLRKELIERLSRPAGERFRAPQSSRNRGYAPADVDHLCDRLAAYLLSPTQARSLSAADVRLARFAGADQRRTGYDPTQVDAFFEDAAHQLLLIGYDVARELNSTEEEASEVALRTARMHLPRRARTAS